MRTAATSGRLHSRLRDMAELRRNSLRCADDLRHKSWKVFSRQPRGWHRKAKRGHDSPPMVSDRRGEAAHPRVELFIIVGVGVAPDAVELRDEVSNRRNGVRRVPGERLHVEMPELFLGMLGE